MFTILNVFFFHYINPSAVHFISISYLPNPEFNVVLFIQGHARFEGCLNQLSFQNHIYEIPFEGDQGVDA